MMEGESRAGFTCSVCGESHLLSLSYSFKFPLALAAIPEEERDARVVWTPDQCVIDNKDFYLRGRIPVPIHGLEEPFIWGVWAEVSPKNFIRTNELWNTEGREAEPAFAGYLNSELLPYGNTVDLELSVQTQSVGRRPHFTVSDPNHPLAIEQHTGISLERIERIAEQVLHPEAE
ncbi:MAG TPA: DUF2199 domain-containing protein [Acidobacteriaceae bacterium]|jgi:hypothetical protein